MPKPSGTALIIWGLWVCLFVFLFCDFHLGKKKNETKELTPITPTNNFTITTPLLIVDLLPSTPSPSFLPSSVHHCSVPLSSCGTAHTQAVLEAQSVSPSHYHPRKFLHGSWNLTCWNLKESRGSWRRGHKRKIWSGEKKVMPQLQGTLFTRIHPPLKVPCTTQGLPREEIPHVLKEKSMLASVN